MDCVKCQDLLSDFLDGTLSAEENRRLNAHLEECLHCVGVRDDLSSIVSFCQVHREEYDSPPDPQALWLRISNVIEAENQTVSRAAATAAAAQSAGGWWSRMMGKRWEFSLPQMATAVSAIVVAVALGTVAGLRLSGGDATFAPEQSGNVRNFTMRQQVSAPDVRVQTLLGRQQLAINYYNERVQERKARWNPQMREAFERNMSVIDSTVEDALIELRTNPHDEVSEEMLNTALNEKVDLLREFSDL